MPDLLSSPDGEDFFCLNVFKPPRSGDGSLRGLESRARCAGFSVTEIGNRKERLRDYASFPDEFPQAGLGGSPIVTP